jgi:hypothetical protein
MIMLKAFNFMPQSLVFTILVLLGSFMLQVESACQYIPVNHRLPEAGEMPVTEAGNYGMAGTTYVLVNDISAEKSAIFLGKDVSLDLNGYTITYANGNYEHIPNGSFEEGLTGWDLTKAPSAGIVDTRVHVFIGNNMLHISAGEEIVSQYINLPVPGRSYFAMCGVGTWDMKVSVYVEDEQGRSIKCITDYRDSSMISCPVENRSPRLGGGFVIAHLNRLPAGKYRIRIKAETDCLVDYIDIRPGMDTGIGIVEKTHPAGHNDHLYNSVHSAFFDYTADAKQCDPLPGIPVVKGKGTVTIRNGVIRNGTPAILSWGIQSTADDVNIILDNVKIISSGINSTAVDVPQATITSSTFDVDNPFIINRHGSEFYAVDLRGDEASEVSFSEFHGGQGCLSFKGNYSRIHHNYFVNRQTVTNHYSIMAMGDSSQIFANRIEPETGSGIEIYVHRGIEIFNNVIRITAAPPTSEYGHEEYSTTAIRIADYNAKPGSPDGCFGNKVYNNKLYITGRDYPDYTDYIPMAWAVFYSASAGDNYIFGNRIEVNNLDPGAKNDAAAFYIGGGTIGGQFNNNLITTNAAAVWVASRYGGAKDTRIYDNQIIKSGSASTGFKAIRMGWMGWKGCVAENIQFESNEISGAPFEIDATDQSHSYSVSWTLSIHVTDKSGKGVEGALIKISDKDGNEVLAKKSAQDGSLTTRLEEYSYASAIRNYKSPYMVRVENRKEKLDLNKNQDINVKIPK